MSPSLEGFKDSEELLIVSVIVEFQRCEGLRVVGNQMYISIDVNGQDCAQGIVQGISFHNNLLIRDPLVAE